MKKFVSMILCLLLCASMLATLPQAVCNAEEITPDTVVSIDPINPEGPEEPEPPLQPQEDLPDNPEECF